MLFFSLYLVAVAQGGHKPCVQAFGADQFDVSDPEECKAKSSFFNWWYFGICAGTSMTLTVLTYIQNNLGWGLDFGIPCIVMVFALLLFLLGTRTYRYSSKGDEESPFVRIGKVFVAALRCSFPFMIAFLFQLLELTPGNPLELQCCKELERGCSYLLFPW